MFKGRQAPCQYAIPTQNKLKVGLGGSLSHNALLGLFVRVGPCGIYYDVQFCVFTDFL